MDINIVRGDGETWRICFTTYAPYQRVEVRLDRASITALALVLVRLLGGTR